MATDDSIQRYVIDADGDFPAPIGAWAWALGDARARTLALLARSTAPDLERELPGAPGSIGSLLFHIAATDMNWLYEDILERAPDEPDERFDRHVPYPYRDSDGKLFAVSGESLEQHLERLHATREILLDTLRAMTPEEFLRERRVGTYVTTPQWIVNHLAEHERYHAGQISLLLAAR